MATTVDLNEAKNQLASLLDRAASGEEVVIARDGQPLVKLVPVPRPKKAAQAIRPHEDKVDISGFRRSLATGPA